MGLTWWKTLLVTLVIYICTRLCVYVRTYMYIYTIFLLINKARQVVAELPKIYTYTYRYFLINISTYVYTYTYMYKRLLFLYALNSK